MKQEHQGYPMTHLGSTNPCATAMPFANGGNETWGGSNRTFPESIDSENSVTLTVVV